MNVFYVIYKYFEIKVGKLLKCKIIVIFGGKVAFVYIIV